MKSSHLGLPWALILGLGALALVRPALQIVLDQAGVSSPPALSVGVTVAITVVWIAVVGVRPVRRPVVTLVLAGLSYAVLSIVLSSIASPILTGQLQGPLATPAAIVPVLLTNAIWGAIAGGLALLLQHLRGARPEHRIRGGVRP